MKPKFLLIIAAMATAVFIGSWVYAGGMMGGGMGGGGMMGSGQGYSNPRQTQSPNYNNNRFHQRAYPDSAEETEKLREEIREKRQELHALYRSEKPDPDLIDKRIDELYRLEAELDQKMLNR